MTFNRDDGWGDTTNSYSKVARYNKDSRRGNNQDNGSRNRSKNTRDGRSDFEGEYDSINGHVFQTRDECRVSLQFDKTCKELGRLAMKKFKHPDDILTMIMSLEETKFDLPTTPVKRSGERKVKKSLKLLYKMQMTRYMERTQTYEDNKKKLYMIVWDQCSRAMQNRLESGKGYKRMKSKKNVVKLLKKIKGDD